MADNANFNWDAETFFRNLTTSNLLAQQNNFAFCRVSGLAGFEEALAKMQSTTAFVCVQNEDDGYTSLENTPHTRRVKTVFFAMRHAMDSMEARSNCFETMRELFRQFMTVLIMQKTKLAERNIYLDQRIQFNEIESYFASGCACAYFNVAVDVFTDLRYNKDEWDPAIFNSAFSNVFS